MFRSNRWPPGGIAKGEGDAPVEAVGEGWGEARLRYGRE